MLPKKKLTRINQLAKKAKEVGLTNAEAKEQSRLRGEYLRAFRASMKKTIENVRIVDPSGEDVTPNKLRNAKNRKKKH